ncbi:hypothetical protein EDC04DRAFT_967759 [Pisolithus marmoratus]|nr:hypothetical protein EDC04DRAFT_967759 [Pisolithus marmoratus]
MSLLTPSEAHAFQSFLTSLDAAEFATDWNMQLDLPHEHTPPVQARDALTKATRDLMSLDADKLRYPLRSSPGGSSATSVHRHPQSQNSLSLLLACAHRSSDGRVHTSSAPISSSSRPYISSQGTAVRSSSDDLRSSPPACQSPSSANGSVKRSSPLGAASGTKRHRLSNGSVTHSPGEEKNNRAALLSPSQKKANHIQSEQKRRANIRRGYDALCEIVPALREACRAEEERVLAHGKNRGRRRGKSKEDGEKDRRQSRPEERERCLVQEWVARPFNCPVLPRLIQYTSFSY